MASNPRDIILAPVVSEKSYGLLDDNVYTFLVARSANKIEIRQAVEAIFGVRVLDVNTLTRQGKTKRRYRRGGAQTGRRPDQKRAIVRIVEGDRIELFEV